MRILIADDDFVNRKFLEKMFLEYGEAIGVDNGMSAVEEVVQALEEKKPNRPNRAGKKPAKDSKGGK